MSAVVADHTSDDSYIYQLSLVLATATTSFLFLFFSIPFIILAPLSSPSLPVVTQIWGHIAGPPPSPLRYVPSFISREELSIFFPRRLASNCAYPRCYEALSAADPLFAFLQIKPKSRHGGNRTQGPTLVVFEAVDRLSIRYASQASSLRGETSQARTSCRAGGLIQIQYLTLNDPRY